jgi:hypothetical protein
MINKILIDIDTDRELPILIGKTPDTPQPTNEEEAKQMILTDIECIGETLLSVIHMAHANGYGDKETLVKSNIEKLTKYLTEKPDGHS